MFHLNPMSYIAFSIGVVATGMNVLLFFLAPFSIISFWLCLVTVAGTFFINYSKLLALYIFIAIPPISACLRYSLL